jgi:adenosylhomocysteine nucleosidase
MPVRCAFTLALLAAGCATPRPVVLISADSEWKALLEQVPAVAVSDTPYGPWFTHPLGDREVIFFHGGYGKVRAAGSTQYAIERWHPPLLLNLGTCGGFGPAQIGDVTLVDKTVIYDLLEAMGDADQTIADYSTALDVSRWPEGLRSRVRVGTIVSGDRDLVPAEVNRLAAKYHASVGDWESGAIAYVAAHNQVPLVILRQVTDVVTETSNPTAGNLELWQRSTRAAMASLLALAAEAMPAFARSPSSRPEQSGTDVKAAVEAGLPPR